MLLFLFPLLLQCQVVIFIELLQVLVFVVRTICITMDYKQ